MNKIGFKTSAVIAQEEAEAQQENTSEAMGGPTLQGVTMGMLGTPQLMENLKAETTHRVELLGSLILSGEFAGMPIEHKQHVLTEFLYMSKVAEAIV